MKTFICDSCGKEKEDHDETSKYPKRIRNTCVACYHTRRRNAGGSNSHMNMTAAEEEHYRFKNYNADMVQSYLLGRFSAT